MHKKIRIILLAFLILISVYFGADLYAFNKKNKNIPYKFRITYMFLDYNKTDNNAKMSDYHEGDKELLTYAQSYENVIKKGNYYIVHINNVNSVALQNITDYAFAKNNVFAEMIDDIKYDKKKNEIIIPKKYFENVKKSQIPLKMEIVSRIKKSDLRNVKFSVETEKIFNSKKISYFDNSDYQTKFSIFKYGKGSNISERDFKIYLNDDEEALSKDYYEWNPKAGVVTLTNNFPITINKVTVRVKKISMLKTMFSFLNINPAYAKNKYTIAGRFSDTGDTYVSNIAGKTASTNNTPYFYIGSDGYFCGGNIGYYSVDCSKLDSNYFTSSSNKNAYKAYKKAKKQALKTENPNTDLYSDQDFLVKVSKLESKSFSATKNETVTKSDGTKETVTHSRSITVDFNKDWALLWCRHLDEGENNNDKTGLDLTYKINSVTSTDLNIYITKGSTTAGNQEAVAYLKFKKEDGQISVQKKTYGIGLTSAGISGSNASIEDIAFTLYTDQNSDGTCGGEEIETQYTGSTGVATFKGLDANETYCIQEDYTEIDDNSTISNNEYIRVNSITGSAFTSAKPTPGNVAGEPLAFGPSITCKATTSGTTCDYYNTKVKYCYVVNKTDMNSAHDFKTIQLCVGPNCANNGGNRVALCGFEYNGGAGIDVTESDVTTNTNDENYFGTLRDANGNVISHIPWSSAIPMTLNKDANGYYWSCPDCYTTPTVTQGKQVKKYACLKVTKVDKMNPSLGLPNATFEARCSNGSVARGVSDSSGVATIYAGVMKNGVAPTCDVTEIIPPKGYGLTDPATQSGLGTTIISEAKALNYRGQSDEQVAAAVTSWCDATSGGTYANPPLMINWYKASAEDDKSDKNKKGKKLLEGAHFTVTNSAGGVVHHTGAKANVTAKLGGETVTRACYVYSENTNDPTDFVSDANGQVCIRGITDGSYTVTETLPAKYHTFSGNYILSNLKTSVDFAVMSDDNTQINEPTGFRFTKNVKSNVDGSDNDNQKIVINNVEKSITDINTEELMKLDFEIYEADSNGNPTGSPIYFIKNETTGIYEYAINVNSSTKVGTTVHGVSGTATTILHLDNKKNINVDHLPWDASTQSTTYVIREVQSKVCDSTKDENDCIGYYYPDYKAQTSSFTITPCSYDKDKVNADSCPTRGFATQDLVNTPTLLEFTKSDFYGYDDQADVQDKNREKDESEVKFENAKEVSDFDRIDFRVKDSSGNYVNFIFVGNSGPCTSESSYSIYKYIPGLTLPTGVDPTVFNDTVGGITQTVHACGGHIHFTNLCRGNTYTIYEDEVPSDSVYVREEKQDEPKTSATVKIPCTDGGQNEKTSTTAIISDKPTYFEVQKRDSKYNYLIPDETATFRLYQCEKGKECHPTDLEDLYTEDKEKLSAAGVRKVIKFYDKAAISGNQEASKDHEKDEDDSEYALLDIEVYRAMSDSDIDDNTAYVTDIHPDRGRLVFRYLQSGYSYVLVETVAPKNYTLPIGRNAETKFTVISTTVDVEAKDTPNVPTSLLIRKYNEDSTKLLAGAEFKIYEAQTTCNKNQDPWAQTGLKEVKLKTIRDGVYEARPETDTTIVKTCLDKEDAKCNEIPTNTQTRLTDLEYAVGSSEALEEDTWADFENILYKSEENGTTKTEKVSLQEGEALIQYLEYGHCYVIEETKAPTGYSLPKKKKDRYTMVQIEENEQYGHDTGFVFKNTPTPFTFYKYDEFNQLLDGAEFKLQKLNDDKKYEDIAVTEEEKEVGLFYKYEGLAKDGDNTVIHTKDGKATVYYLPVGQYRIVETKAAPGKELTKNPNIATFFVDEAGNTFGNAIVVNKPETKKIIPKNSASAELIVNIQTGQIVMRYGAIILTIIGLIIGLMVLRKKTK